MLRPRLATLLATVSLACGLYLSTSAQTVTGSLEGRVTDQTGAVIPGAKVAIRNVETGQERVVGHSASRPFPRWSPDGREIAYTDKNCLLVMKRDGSSSRRVVCAPAAIAPRFAYSEIGSLGWSPDGSKLTWTVHNEREQRIEMWIVDRGTGKHEVWAGENNYGYWPGESTWSPDGTRIAFRMDHKPDYEIWRLRNLLSRLQSAD